MCYFEFYYESFMNIGNTENKMNENIDKQKKSKHNASAWQNFGCPMFEQKRLSSLLELDLYLIRVIFVTSTGFNYLSYPFTFYTGLPRNLPYQQTDLMLLWASMGFQKKGDEVSRSRAKQRDSTIFQPRIQGKDANNSIKKKVVSNEPFTK